MKNILIIILLASMACIVYFFVEEQFKGVVLTQKENILLSVLYIVVGLSVLLLIKIKSSEKKK
ncbi:MAG TPA: hypothetical protein VIJ92_16790 [Ginsengibacter sp.]